MAFRVVLDANVLYPFYVRDVLLRLAEAEIYDARWSERIVEEVVRNLPGAMPAEKAERIRQVLLDFEEAIVPAAAIAALEPAMTNSAEDRHVLATAVACGAQVIVTNNLGDFPEEACGLYGIEPLQPDDFLVRQSDIDPDRIIETLSRQAFDLRNVETLDQLLDRLAVPLPSFVAVIRPLERR